MEIPPITFDGDTQLLFAIHSIINRQLLGISPYKIFEKELCISPIPSLAMHCTNVNSIFGLSPNINWSKLWEENEN